MIEVPAAAIAADQFDAEFFSIGSNDLTQYVAAAGRDIGAVADLADPVQPAMLRLLRFVVDAARAQQIDVSLCGDAGGDPRAIPLLLAAGLRTLSMAPALVGGAKLAVAAVDLASRPGARAMAEMKPERARGDAVGAYKARAETGSRHAAVRNAPSPGDRVGKESFVHLADRQSGLCGANPATAPRYDFRDLPLHRRRSA